MLSFYREGAKTKTLGKSFETLIDRAKAALYRTTRKGGSEHEKTWETPVLEIVSVGAADVLCVSGGNPGGEDLGEWDFL